MVHLSLVISESTIIYRIRMNSNLQEGILSIEIEGVHLCSVAFFLSLTSLMMEAASSTKNHLKI